MEELKWNEQGLVCAVAQDFESGEVLMQAYMNEEAYRLTLETGYAHYWSRSRKGRRLPYGQLQLFFHARKGMRRGRGDAGQAAAHR